MTRKLKLYHLTHIDFGPILEVKRRSPRWPSEGEPKTPRLCVCPTVLQCFASRLFDPKFLHVYSIVARGVTPYNVWDQFITDERWLIPGQRLSHEAVLPCSVVVAAQRETRRYTAARKSSTWRLRLLTLLEAADAIEHLYPRGCKFWRRIAEDYGISLQNPDTVHNRNRKRWI